MGTLFVSLLFTAPFVIATIEALRSFLTAPSMVGTLFVPHRPTYETLLPGIMP